MAAPRRSPRIAALPARASAPELTRFLPSRRSLAAGLALLAFAGAAYAVARETSLFALRSIDVRGGTPAIRAEVQTALRADVGTSLLAIDAAGLSRRLEALPDVRRFTFDRDFPHTLRVTVRRQHPVLVVRRVPGKQAFLVASSGRVLRRLANPLASHLPRLWVTRAVSLTVGADLPPGFAAAATSAYVAENVRLPGGLRTVRETATELTLSLGTGLEVRLGSGGDLRLKLAIARRIIAASGGASLRSGYLDVSVPGRPVLSAESQVEG